MLAGTAPVPASSGKTVRYRLNRPGDRHSTAWHTVALCRLQRDPRTRAYADRRRARRGDQDVAGPALTSSGWCRITRRHSTL